MESAILEIIAAIKAGGHELDAAWLDRLLRRHNRTTHDATRRVAKRRLLPYYLSTKANDPGRWESWQVDTATEQALLRILKVKPRRTASGVATITVITRPWPCSSDCLYCPNDVRMPKSYLSDEPACQRAERNFFDPYLQVRSRLVALSEMGHVTDKVELIVLGGTWSDYPRAYQLWFVSELFRAVNDFGESRVAGEHPEERDRRYRACGLTYNKDELLRRTGDVQRQVDEGLLSYNEAIRQIGGSDAWRAVEAWQQATTDDLLREHVRNEEAAHRVVGLTIETRPDLISPETAREMRELGCTKVQMGIQSLDQHILEANQRRVSVAQIADAFCALRLAGFKIQVHFMANLLGATPEADKADYLRLVSDERFLPDEVKLYPCCLVQSSRLGACYADGSWQPYGEDELMDLLVADTLATPAYTRISRMIRDISSTDIVAGNKRTNLRQMVEARIARLGAPVHEIRMREVATTDVDPAALRLDCVAYRTTVSDERFLQWVTDDGRIAAFLRLSLPREGTQAMIREVHVYGRVASLGSSERGGAQHAGLGRQLVEEACAQAREAGFSAINVISSVGTRGYYRNLGFGTAGLYQQRSLTADAQAGTGQTQT
ncbi:MAG: tRNA uridine(34) 5-carboxymethylaminomethyl modification radical SAM/GNAT enzyme Elp3 [Atopobiaceae bacterium]|nr:tRNA uridine(34) 5-carboxymethylaminomethyl modification radical SAM/GNAT enzyme Elp3 [Atopobiaceae bacterium]